MGRKSKEQLEKERLEGMTEVTEPTAKNEGNIPPEVQNYSRNSYGLLKNVSYKFKDDCSIDWKAMIPSEYIVINDDWFNRRNIQVPETTEGLDDKQLLVLLGGIKEVAKIRGLIGCYMRVDESSDTRVVVTCKVRFSPNYETSGEYLEVEATANATVYNTDRNFQIFLEPIASNRAFVRAVRSALRIDIVGNDELNTASYDSGAAESGGEPWRALAQKAKEKKNFSSFSQFKEVLIEKNIPDCEGWNDWSDIPTTLIWKFLGQLNKA